MLYWQSNICFILPTYVRNIRCDEHLASYDREMHVTIPVGFHVKCDLNFRQ